MLRPRKKPTLRSASSLVGCVIGGLENLVSTGYPVICGAIARDYVTHPEPTETERVRFGKTSRMAERDVESIASVPQFVAKLRRLADALESGERFRIQVAGERFRVPRDAELSVEHERSDDMEEVELQMRWSINDDDDDEDDDVIV